MKHSNGKPNSKNISNKQKFICYEALQLENLTLSTNLSKASFNDIIVNLTSRK